jgi:hypothetical protein
MILSNEVQLDAKGVRERLWDLIEAMERSQAYSGELAVGITPEAQSNSQLLVGIVPLL